MSDFLATLALALAASEPASNLLEGDQRQHAVIDIWSSYCLHRKEGDPSVLRATVEIEVGESGTAANVILLIPDPTKRLNRHAVRLAKRQQFGLPPGTVITREVIVNCEK